MIKFLLPDNLIKDSTVTNVLPHKYRELRIMFNEVAVHCMTGSWGTMIFQTGVLAGHYYSEQYFDPLIDIEVTAVIEYNLISIHFVHQSTSTLSGLDDKIFQQEGKQSMHYFPEGKSYKLTVAGGHIRHSVIIVPRIDMLDAFKNIYPQLAQLMECLEQKESAHLALPYDSFRRTSHAEIRKIKKCKLSPDTREIYFNNRITDLVIGYLEIIHRVSLDDRIIARNRVQLDELINQIEQAPEHSISIKHVAKRMKLPQRIIEQVFIARFGTTPILYIQLQRMEKAKELLNTTDLSVAEVGERVGYVDASYFTRVFRNVTGKTPRAYRRYNS
jgi:AraC-like DNA-binding protein